MSLCQSCHAAPIVGRIPGKPPHRNTKYCEPCREGLVKQPAAHITEGQAEQIRALLGKMTRTEIAERVGISRSRVNRWIQQEGLKSNVQSYPAEVVEAVLQAYAAAPQGQGKHSLREQFGGDTMRHVVERYGRGGLRQKRWTDDEIREAAKMAGLVSRTAQARYFGRPNAFEGSIKALWAKRFKTNPSDINGLGVHRAAQISQSGCPAVLVERQDNGHPIAKVLWLDLACHLRADLPDWIVDAVSVLARFQAWLHGAETSEAIRDMIQERESVYGHSTAGDERA